MIDNSEAQELHELIGAAIAGDTSGLARARELAAVVVSDTEPIPGTKLREDNLAVWFTPAAIVDAFDGDEDELATWVRSASDVQLASIGEACLSADSLWELFHELIETFVREDMEAEAHAAGLVAVWTEEARALGRQHGPNPTDETDPLDIIDLQALADATGEGTSWGELTEIQNAVTAAYEQGVSEAHAARPPEGTE